MDIFSKRTKRDQGTSVEAYKYDTLPEPLKNQIIFIVERVLGSFPAVQIQIRPMAGGEMFFLNVQQVLCEEYGLRRLSNASASARENVWTFFRQEQKVEKC